MAVLKAEKIFRKAAKESAAGSEWEKLFSGLADLAGDVACVVNNDGTVNVLDLIDLLLAFGTACP